MPVTDQEKDIIEQMYLEKPNIQSISDELGHSPVTIRRILKDRGIIVSGTPGRPSLVDQIEDAELEALVNAVQAGKEPLATIAVRHHMSVGTLYKVLRNLGVTPRTQSEEHLRAEGMRKDVAVQMYKEGWAQWFIYQQTGLSSAALNKELHIRGVQLRGRGGHGKVPLKDAEGKLVVGEGGKYVAVSAAAPRDPERVRELLRKVHEAADKGLAGSSGLADASRRGGEGGGESK